MFITKHGSRFQTAFWTWILIFDCCFVTNAALCLRPTSSGVPCVASFPKIQRRLETKNQVVLRHSLLSGFCICSHIEINCVTIEPIMAYLEFLVQNGVSVHMVANNISAVKANFVMMGLDHTTLEHPHIKYFTKSMKINRPLAVTQRNIMSLETRLSPFM